jgi:hypothetical protein
LTALENFLLSDPLGLLNFLRLVSDDYFIG